MLDFGCFESTKDSWSTSSIQGLLLRPGQVSGGLRLLATVVRWIRHTLVHFSDFLDRVTKKIPLDPPLCNALGSIARLRISLCTRDLR